MTREILPFVFLLGCGGGSDDGGGTDATTNDSPNNMDSAPSDSAPADTGTDSAIDDGGATDAGADTGTLKDSGPMGQCQTANDCKLFSSYCSKQPCVCIPLGKNDPNPKCMGQMVTCLMDPCNNKIAVCDGGTCGVGP